MWGGKEKNSKEVRDCQFNLLGQDNRTSRRQRLKSLFNYGLPIRVTLIGRKLTCWDPAGPSHPWNDDYKLSAFKGSWINKLSFGYWRLGNGFLLSRVSNNNSPACQMPHLPKSKVQNTAQVLSDCITQWHTVRAELVVMPLATAKLRWQISPPNSDTRFTPPFGKKKLVAIPPVTEV